MKSRPLVAAIALVLLGAAIGITADRLLHHGMSLHEIRLRHVQEDPMGAMDRAIRMTPEQRARIADIFQKRQGAVDVVWSDTHVRLRATIDSIVNEIAAQLDPDQAAKFRRLADELHNRTPIRH